MEIRRLAPEERFDAELISTVAFHFRMEDPEKQKEISRKGTVEDWGAFDTDGRMMAHIMNHCFESNLDGTRIRNGGIGGVSTLPEYRNSGAIRAIFSELLPSAWRTGEVISTLYPFNHAFYRKFGYETVCPRNVYSFPPSVLREYRFDGPVRQWKPGDSIAPYLHLNHTFAQSWNLSVFRGEERFREAHFEGRYYRDRKFAYLLGTEEAPCAYVIFQDVRRDPAALLRIEDLAWQGREGFHALLGFLGRFTADYGTVELPLPRGMELLSLIHSPDAYDISKQSEQSYMIRVVNVPELLKAMRKPPRTDFILRVTDEMIPENNGSWRVCGEAVTGTELPPDLELNVRALGPLAAGGISLAEAVYREDVTLLAPDRIPEGLFARRPVFIQERF